MKNVVLKNVHLTTEEANVIDTLARYRRVSGRLKVAQDRNPDSSEVRLLQLDLRRIARQLETDLKAVGVQSATIW